MAGMERLRPDNQAQDQQLHSSSGKGINNSGTCRSKIRWVSGNHCRIPRKCLGGNHEIGPGIPDTGTKFTPDQGILCRKG